MSLYWITPQVAVTGIAIAPNNWPELATTHQIGAVVNLRQEYNDIFCEPYPAAYLWLPVTDYTDPSIAQLQMGAAFIDMAVRSGQRVLVHCLMGIGRSPTMAAAYLVYTGYSVEGAINEVMEKAERVCVPCIRPTTLKELARQLKAG
jgi:protein-tyrosine phosphatase